MIVSLNPLYRCNLRCDFCYLTEEQLRSKQVLDLRRLDQMLAEVQAEFGIEHLDLYGGEITILPQPYLDSMFDTIRKHYSGRINLVTNLTRIHPVLFREGSDSLDISVSYDFQARPSHEQVLSNMALIGLPLHVLMLATPGLMNLDVDHMVSTLNAIPNVESVEIKPYSASQANDLPMRFSDFENFVLKWLEHPHKRFEFVNERNIRAALRKEYSSFSDNHLYITPAGKYAVLEFDEADREYFLEKENLDEIVSWFKLEYNRTVGNGFCKTCPYLGHCLSEHLRDVKSLEHSCNGFHNLLRIYEDTRL